MSAPPNAPPRLSAYLLQWLRDNIRIATDMSVVVQELRQRGYPDVAIASAIEEVRPRIDAFSDDIMRPPLLHRAPPGLRRVDDPRVQLFTLEDFIDGRECAELIALINDNLRPSTVAHATAIEEYRTSQTCDLALLRSPVAMRLEEKVCRTLGIRASYSEGMQAQRYDVGQQFKPHWDFYEPGSESYRRQAGLRGNRTWTFMVYLNEGMEGGATRFTKIGHAIQPRTGMAVLWNNLRADGSPNEATMHCGEPVTAGCKLIITQWFRRFGEGPVFC